MYEKVGSEHYDSVAQFVKFPNPRRFSGFSSKLKFEVPFIQMCSRSLFEPLQVCLDHMCVMTNYSLKVRHNEAQ